MPNEVRRMRTSTVIFAFAIICSAWGEPSPFGVAQGRWLAHAQTPPANPMAKFMPALLNSGANNVSSIVYVGKGMAALPGPTGQLAAGPAVKFTAAIAYGLMSTRVEIERPANPKRIVQFMTGDTAWDVVDGKKPALNP